MNRSTRAKMSADGADSDGSMGLNLELYILFLDLKRANYQIY